MILSRRRVLALAGVAALPVPALAADKGSSFAALSRRWLAGMLALGPVNATALGDHHHDGELDDLSPAGRTAASTFSNKILTELGRIDLTGLPRAEQVDAKMLQNALRFDLWSREVLKDWSWDPLIYTNLAGQALYGLMARDFAPLPKRLAAAVGRIEKLPGLWAQMRANLDPARVPAVHAETAAKQHSGTLSLAEDLIVAQAGNLPPAGRSRLDTAMARLKTESAAQQDWLDKTLVPAAKGDFRLGAEHYDQKLGFLLASPLTRMEIRKRAEAAMAKTREEMYAQARRILAARPGAPPAPDKPGPAEQQAAIKAALDLAAAERPARNKLVETAEKTLATATDFVRKKDFITLPDAPVQVILMPKFQQGVAVAYCDWPGPLDKGLPTFYAVSPIPDDWTAEKADSFLREYNDRGIQEIAVHEAMPGHYVQGAHANAYPSVLRAALASGSFVEGWAMYAEDLMADTGFLDGDPLYVITHLKVRLRAISNAILDQAIHVDGMDHDAAMKLMVEGAFQEQGEADGKWVRARVSSGQLSTYFVGYEEHWNLRHDAEHRWGPDFALKRYHDTALSFGSPPVRFIGQLMFDQPII
ncbi:MAG TPA: DUF885 domain-containing protein [Alphaproteobacteria bacterium]|jgi:uncharacterized protein (DUF885 family)|nr:DUF885 domain-containing protein [Alphaproteobacteria bacterium]